jgi:hypothetical protein
LPSFSSLRLFLCSLLFAVGVAGAEVQPETAARLLDLSGSWRFSLGIPEPAFPQGGLPEINYTDSIALPGTTETRDKGPLNNEALPGQLTRVRKFEGPAWYEREVDIPASWAGRRVILTLERSKLTQVWFDGRPCGSQLLFGAPQRYDLSSVVSPGRHRLSILVDNRLKHWPLSSDIHQYSDGTQTNWNGIIGRIELSATDLLWLDEVQAHPNFAARSFTLKIRIAKRSGADAACSLSAQAESFNHEGTPQVIAPRVIKTDVTGPSQELQLELPLGSGALLWDEFSPALYRVKIRLDSAEGSDERTLELGLREIKTRDAQFCVNDRTVFLRGKHDACVFPLTGHPPMDLEGWMRHLRICRDYGINHVRCHSYLPPEAAFAAADRLGIYLQPELPFWGTFDEKARDALSPEAEAALREYGNHASFALFTLGNELGGNRALMNALVTRLRGLDPRHLYSDGSNNVLWEPRLQPTNDFWVSAKIINAASNGKALPARGSFCVFDGNEGHVQWGAADTRADLSAAVAGVPVPVVGHETGQWTVYPNFGEIAKYTGVLRARNFERLRASLARHGMADQDGDFARASGLLSAQLYREENELALRTPGFGGFQLLDLQDYPGQGTALVGMLDAFMDSKGLITPEQWRRSCSEIVALARFDRYTWTQEETYVADLQLAHYGPKDLQGAVVEWRIVGADGKVFAREQALPADFRQGGLRTLGKVRASLAQAAAPARYSLEVTLTCGDRVVRNDWPLWVYPAKVKVETKPLKGFSLVRAYDAETRSLLAEGRRVLLIPSSNNWANTVKGGYATDYWNWAMFNGTPGTMGLLCRPEHPALAEFPTAFYSERQWSVIAHASTPVILSRTPSAFRPIVQVIDNYERNEKIGLIFETRRGKGSLLVCAVDLFSLASANPEARQLLSSLQHYAASPAFAPQQELDEATLSSLLCPNLAEGRPVKASSHFQPPWGVTPVPERAVDGDICTRWIAKDDDSRPSLEVDLGRVCDLNAVELLWENDEPGYGYLIEGSADGSKWEILSDQCHNNFTGNRHYLPVKAKGIRHLRLTAVTHPAGSRFCLRDLRVLGR